MSNLDIKKFAEYLTRDRRTLEMFRYLVTNSFIRVVKYHNTAPADAARFERELSAYARCFCPVTADALNRFYETRKWPYDKPGLIIALYDGLRNQYDVMLPLLEQYGFCGWFFIPCGFIDTPAQQQHAYTLSHDLADVQQGQYPDGRYALSWEEIRRIAARHEICCHTDSHIALSPDVSAEALRREIVDAKRTLEQRAGRRVDVFAWKSGAEYDADLRAHRYFEEAGYRFLVSSVKIEKIG